MTQTGLRPSASPDQSVVLQGPDARLEPLLPERAAELLSAAESPDTFRYFSRRPDPWTPDGFLAFIEFLKGPAATVPYCVVLPESGRPVGITTYLDIRPEHRALEIGWTWLAPDQRGTKTNPAMKRLMLAHAFDDLGCLRVQLKTDLRNLQSQQAIEKLGAKKEGVLRSHVLMPDGHRRDTVMYSILAEEWPEVQARLDARLAAP